ncbi:unnamed protein product [Strongylus vulgaris]|uniref:Uncharacterized protein n=1 Tax=Strongylus vulgaris TaxID=40348 RepID=A0A3P7J6D1_STRVU|nr:unnamed protein product [Strongylus vulgaris]
MIEGDFWSFSSETGRFAVSCDPDIRCFSIADDNIFACCLHSDGVVLSPAHIMKTVNASHSEEDKENMFVEKSHNHALDVIVENRQYLRFRQCRDNAAVITVIGLNFSFRVFIQILPDETKSYENSEKVKIFGVFFF